MLDISDTKFGLDTVTIGLVVMLRHNGYVTLGIT